METVVVVGAGPTGLALACGLRAGGISVRVLDGAAGPAVTSRALGLQPRGVEVLDRLGALGELPDGGWRFVPLSSPSTAGSWRGCGSGSRCRGSADGRHC
jgi:4,5-epoxidase